MAKLKVCKFFSVWMVLMLVAALGAAMLTPSAVEANSCVNPVYVNGTTGNDAWDGSSPTSGTPPVGPKQTIQAGIGAVCDGGTVYVAAGTYGEDLVIDKSLTLISDSGDYRSTGTILNGPIELEDVVNVTIQGFKFQDCSSSGYKHVIYTGGTADNIMIAANSFESCEGQNIHIYYGGGTWFDNWTITDNKISNVTGTNASGIWIQRLRNSTINNNYISNTSYAGMILDRIENVTVSNNNISNTPRKGIQVATSPNCNVVIEDNYITNANTLLDADEGAITIYPDVTNIHIKSNTLTGNYQGFTVRDKAGAVSDVYVNFNNICGNDGFGIGNFAQGGGTVDATNNWWGANDGPNASPGSGDKASANVDYTPWLVIDISASPDVIVIGGDTSNITAYMTKNSAGQDTSAQGHIPDGTEIIFTTTAGSIGSTTATKATTNGMATATLTLSVPSEATVCAEAPHGAQVPKAQYAACTTVDLLAPPGAGVSPTTSTGARPLNPPQMSAQYVSVNPQQTYANQPVTITTNVVNTGDEAGNLNVALKINGQVEQTRMVSVGPQGTQPVKFTVTKSEPGTYEVAIEGQRASFTVIGGGTSGAPASSGLIALIVIAVLILATAVVLMMTFRRPA